MPGDLVGHPRYLVQTWLGTGGMGTVYRALHRVMDRPVALKVVNPHLLHRPAMVERFRREDRAAARLSHPNIVTAYDADQAGATHFLVMELVEGVNLDQMLAARGPLAVYDACDYARQTALALQYAHECGMVHRDIKPHNLMVAAGGRVKVLDFGLARFASEAAPAPAAGPGGDGAGDGQAGGLTGAYMGLGTEDYLAPEGASDARRSDIRSDVYSLGCTLYRFLTGRVPFPDGDSADKRRCHREATPAPLAGLRTGVPPRLARVVERMLAKDPADRYQTPGEVARALAPFASADPAHVLVVDDDPEIRGAMAAALEAEGFAVGCAANGREALDRLRRGPRPDLVLLDLAMPVVDGWQFLREQQGDPALAGIPVIVLSAADQAQARAAGPRAADYLQKPVGLGDLAAKVRRHVGRG